MYKNIYRPPFNPFLDELKWNEYNGPQVYLDPSRWKPVGVNKSHLDCIMR